MITQDTIKNALRDYTPKAITGDRNYSVLLPLTEKSGEPHILYEVRSDDLDVQPGEISFPGGAIEKGESKQEAAVRETVEELGISPNSIDVLAELNYLVTYSNLTVYSFLGSVPYSVLETASINLAEVKETFTVPLSFFLENKPEQYFNKLVVEPNPDIPKEKIAPYGEYDWHTGTNEVLIYTWFDPEAGIERIIWGMTARLTYDFVQLIRRNL